MPFINFKDQWFQELRKVKLALSGKAWRRSADHLALPRSRDGFSIISFLADGQVNLTQLSRSLHVTKRKLLHVLP